MSVTEKGKVSFIYVANPLMPSESRNIVVRDHKPKKTLSQYLGPLDGEWAVSVSGKNVHKSQFAETYLIEGDCVVVAPMLLGGGDGGGKAILRMVALVALTVFTAGAAGIALAGSIGGAIGVSASVVQAGMLIGGTMLINALIPPAKPKVPGSGSGFESSPTYGIDGPKNLSTKGIPVPVIYGESWFAGNFIQTSVENSGDTQYLHLLLNVGEGPIEGISEIQINNQPIENFTGVETFIRTGEADQKPIPYFSDIIRPVSRSVALKSGTWTIHTVNNPVDRLRLDFVLPRGLHRMDETDGIVSTTTAFLAEIREIGGEWRPFLPQQESVPPGKPVEPTNRISIKGRTISALRKSYYSEDLDKSKRYEIRLSHTESDESETVSNSITLSDVNEILLDDIKYKHTALLGIRIKLSDQLNGIPSVNFKAKGRRVNVWDPITGDFQVKWTNNPAWIVIDAMTNRRFGGGIRIERFKLNYFRRWADHCEKHGLKFNGGIDQKSNLWDALLPIFKVGRAMPIRSGTKFQVSIVGQRKPVQLFTMANIKKQSMSIDWMPADERANEVTISYYDKDNFGKLKSVTVHDQKSRERGDDPVTTEMTLFGVDNLEQAQREGTLALNVNKLLKTINFEAPLDAIACTIGDVIAVQHDMPQWGNGGFLRAGSTANKLKLDSKVEFKSGTSYVAMVRHDKVVQWMGEVETVLGNAIFLSFGFNTQNFDRFRLLLQVSTGKDFKIVEPIIDSYGRHGLLLDSTVGIKVGDTVQLIDTDVIEHINVVNSGNTTDEITLAAALSAIPREETPWAFGPADTVVNLFSILGISGSGDLWRKISAIEYSDAAYSDEVVEYKPVQVPTSTMPSQVTFNGFVERRKLVGAVYMSEIEFSWTNSSALYAYSEIHVSVDGEAWKYVADAPSAYKIQVSAGVVSVQIVPVNIYGSKPSIESTTVYTYEVKSGAPDTPPGVESVRIEPGKNLNIVRWGTIDSWAASKNVYRYEVWAAKGDDSTLEVAELLGITGNDHYTHVNIGSNETYRYWVRAVNVLVNDTRSEFSPLGGVLATTLPAGSFIDAFPEGVQLYDLGPALRDEIENRDVEDISRIVSQLSAKVELVTDSNKVEIFQRKEAVTGVEALVRQEIGTRISENEALAKMLTELSVKVEEDVSAQILEEKQARASAYEALTASINRMKSQIDDDITAQIEEGKLTRTKENEALAGSIQALTSTVNGHTTSISQQLESINGITSQYVVKINNNGYVTGFGLVGSANSSEFSVMADRFKIVNPRNNTAYPVFSVDTARNQVVISNAVVGDLQSDNYVSGVSGWCLKK